MAYGNLTKDLSRFRSERLDGVTVRDFSGGWNVIDNDLNLNPKFAKRLRNMYRDSDGSLRVRPGTKRFARNSDIQDSVVNIDYYNSFLVTVSIDGEIVITNGIGAATIIWNHEIAGKLPGNPNGWGSTDFVSFHQFRGSLLICNGVDKPLIINQYMTVDYLSDLATGSNVNVPIGRYVTSLSRYVVIAGDPYAPSTLYITNVDTSGTFFGDSAPNDAINIDIASRVQTGSSVIRGLGIYRDKLLIMFDECVIFGTLGIYDSNDNHTPSFDDVIVQYGAISHRSIQTTGDDILFCDIVGVPSVTRSKFTNTLAPDRVSQLIDPEIRDTISHIRYTQTLHDGVFSVYNRLEGQYMLFIPNDSTLDNSIERRGFVYSNIPALRVKAWSEFRGWNWVCGCRSAEGRLFFVGKDSADIYILGNDRDVMTRDFIGAQETFDDDTLFTDGTGFNATVSDINLTGLPISFDWELPWGDFDSRLKVKNTRLIHLETRGTGSFTAEAYIDNQFVSLDWLGETFTDGTLFTDDTGFVSEDTPTTPTLSMDFVGGDRSAYGLDLYGKSYGTGRITNDERIYAWTTNCKIMKMRFKGRTKDALRFVSFSIGYLRGSIRR